MSESNGLETSSRPLTEPSPAPPARPWSKVPELKGSRLSALVSELREVEGSIKALEQTKEGIRGLIAEQVRPLGFPVRVYDRQLAWLIPKPGKKLSEKKLVLAGVTPEQIEAGYEETKAKAPHLRVTEVKIDDLVEDGLVVSAPLGGEAPPPSGSANASFD